MSLRTLTLLCVLASPAALAQTSAPSPSFEVASVKSSDFSARMAFTGGPGTDSPGQLTISRYSLPFLIRRAFNKLYEWEYVIPTSVPNDPYDIVARIPAGATKEQFYLMLQNLLVERFGLVAHTETREIPAYKLVAAKDGPKVTPVAELPARPQSAPASGPAVWLNSLDKDKNGWPILPPDTVGQFGTTHPPNTREMYRAQPISQLAQTLQRRFPRPLLDKTGLAGIYSFDLTYPSISTMAASSPELGRLQDAARGGDAAALAQVRALSDAVFDDYNASFLAAMEHQLGLKLVSTKSPVEVLVIDHINSKPTEN
jgi:uncharacterized protein (TIGR03435 family)